MLRNGGQAVFCSKVQETTAAFSTLHAGAMRSVLRALTGRLFLAHALLASGPFGLAAHACELAAAATTQRFKRKQLGIVIVILTIVSKDFAKVFPHYIYTTSRFQVRLARCTSITTGTELADQDAGYRGLARVPFVALRAEPPRWLHWAQSPPFAADHREADHKCFAVRLADTVLLAFDGGLSREGWNALIFATCSSFLAFRSSHRCYLAKIFLLRHCDELMSCFFLWLPSKCSALCVAS